jgi:hypothetical protein
MLIDTEGGAGSYSFQWNPSKTGRSVSVPWNQLRVAGRNSPIQQFGCGNSEEIKIEFDVSRSKRGDGNVKKVVEQLFKMKDAKVGGFVKRPPKLKFIMGDYINETVILLHIDASTDHLAHPTSLLPYQGKIKLTMRVIK